MVSQRRLTKMQSCVTVMTRVSPSFMVGVSFRASLPCLIFVVSHLYIHYPKIATRCIYTLTVGKVLNSVNTNVFQINLGKLLFRATLKFRLGSCLSTALKMDNLDCTKIDAHFKKFKACIWEGLIHEC